MLEQSSAAPPTDHPVDGTLDAFGNSGNDSRWQYLHRFVQELLGHSSLVATQKYLHVATAQLQHIHAKFHPHGCAL
jgi:integrase